MIKFACSLLIVVTAVSAFAQDAATDLKGMEGTWVPTSAELNEKPFPKEVLKTMKLVMEKDKYTVTVGETVDRGSVKLDHSKKPKAMDIVGNDGPNKDKTFLAIYELKDDTLRVCYDLTGKSRPTEFKTQKDALIFLVTYQRQKS